MDASLLWQITATSLFAVFFALAAIVLWAGPRRAVNRYLALYCVLYGCGAITSGLDLFVPDRTLSFNVAIWRNIFSCSAGAVYVAFASRAVEAPLARALRSKGVTAILLVYAVAAACACYFLPTVFVSRGTGTPTAQGGYSWDDAYPGSLALNALFLLCLSVGTIVAIDAVARSTHGTVARSRARAYAVAFITIDSATIIANVPNYVGGYGGIGAYLGIVCQDAILIGLLLVARGMLRYQLFDFDLKLKRSLKRGTLVAIILGAFFVVSALAEQYLQQFGWIVGGLAVGALLFALRPIERAIDRLADRAMPKTTGTPEYLTQRKHEIYRAALEDAMRDGVVSAKERALLLRLAENLRLNGDEALAIERSMLEAAA
jgi:hypothetical protein